MLSYDDIEKDFRRADANTINKGQPLACAHCGRNLASGLRTTFRRLPRTNLPSPVVTIELCGGCTERLQERVERRLGIDRFTTAAPLGIFLLGAASAYLVNFIVSLYRDDPYLNQVMIGIIGLVVLGCVIGAVLSYGNIQRQAASWALSLLRHPEREVADSRLSRFAK